MKKNYLRQISCLGRMVLKWWLCLLLGGMLNLPATAQQKTAPRVNLKVEKTSLIRAIEALRSQTRYNAALYGYFRAFTVGDAATGAR